MEIRLLGSVGFGTGESMVHPASGRAMLTASVADLSRICRGSGVDLAWIWR